MSGDPNWLEWGEPDWLEWSDANRKADREQGMVVFVDKPTYNDWCQAVGLDPADDNNDIAYSEFINNWD